MNTWKSILFVFILSLIVFVSFYWIIYPVAPLHTNSIFHHILYRLISGGGGLIIGVIVLFIVLYAINLLSKEKKSKIVIASTSLKVSIIINIMLAFGIIYSYYKN